MKLPTLRVLSASGLYLRGRLRAMCNSLGLRNVRSGSRSEIVDGYILRANAVNGKLHGLLIDPPAMVALRMVPRPEYPPTESGNTPFGYMLPIINPRDRLSPVLNAPPVVRPPMENAPVGLALVGVTYTVGGAIEPIGGSGDRYSQQAERSVPIPGVGYLLVDAITDTVAEPVTFPSVSGKTYPTIYYPDDDPNHPGEVMFEGGTTPDYPERTVYTAESLLDVKPTLRVICVHPMQEHSNRGSQAWSLAHAVGIGNTAFSPLELFLEVDLSQITRRYSQMPGAAPGWVEAPVDPWGSSQNPTARPPVSRALSQRRPWVRAIVSAHDPSERLLRYVVFTVAKAPASDQDTNGAASLVGMRVTVQGDASGVPNISAAQVMDLRLSQHSDPRMQPYEVPPVDWGFISMTDNIYDVTQYVYYGPYADWRASAPGAAWVAMTTENERHLPNGYWPVVGAPLEDGRLVLFVRAFAEQFEGTDIHEPDEDPVPPEDRFATYTWAAIVVVDPESGAIDAAYDVDDVSDENAVRDMVGAASSGSEVVVLGYLGNDLETLVYRSSGVTRQEFSTLGFGPYPLGPEEGPVLSGAPSDDPEAPTPLESAVTSPEVTHNPVVYIGNNKYLFVVDNGGLACAVFDSANSAVYPAGVVVPDIPLTPEAASDRGHSVGQVQCLQREFAEGGDVLMPAVLLLTVGDSFNLTGYEDEGVPNTGRGTWVSYDSGMTWVPFYHDGSGLAMQFVGSATYRPPPGEMFMKEPEQ